MILRAAAVGFCHRAAVAEVVASVPDSATTVAPKEIRQGLSFSIIVDNSSQWFTHRLLPLQSRWWHLFSPSY